MDTKESFEFVLRLLAHDIERLERVMEFIQLVAGGDERAYEIIIGISDGEINLEAVHDVLDGYLDQNPAK
jgi:hypothetical protein